MNIHAGDRIVDDDYLVAIVGYILNIRSADNSLLAGSPASFYQVVEVQEGYKVAFALAEAGDELIAVPDNFIMVLYITLLP